MTDETSGPRPWDIEQYRGVRRHLERKKDWEEEAELVLDGGFQPGVSPSGKASPTYDTNGPSLFWLALWTSVLTVLTLGFYRFWMLARMRRHYWHAIRVQGDPLEYTGTGLEKILGFLVAIIILAVYLGLVNIGMTFLGLSYVQDNTAIIALSITAALPLFFFATYRARRYLMARTRWRGIRFGMSNGAWGYTVRAMWYWFLTVVTGGLLYPYMQFRLSKFLTDRTWFGDLKFQQNGSWAGLFAYWVWLYIVLGLVILAVWGLAADQGNPTTAVIGWIIIFFGYMSFFIMLLRYEVVAFRYMWSNRTLGEASFENTVAPGKIISTYLVGTLLVGLFTLLVAIVLFLGVGVGVALLTGQENLGMNFDPRALSPDGLMKGDPTGNMPAFIATIVLIYLTFFAIPFAFSQIFITRPILKRKAEAMVIHEVQALTQSRQREHDHAAEAGGFADALGVDVGAGI